MKALKGESGSKMDAISKLESRVLLIQTQNFELAYPFQYLNDTVQKTRAILTKLS